MRKRIGFCWWFAFISTLTTPPLTAAPYSGQSRSFLQPDGSRVEVRLFGDEFYMRGESFDGYTVIRDKDNGYICYAELDSESDELKSTGIPYLGFAFPTSDSQETAFYRRATLGISQAAPPAQHALTSLRGRLHVRLPLERRVTKANETFRLLFPEGKGAASMVETNGDKTASPPTASVYTSPATEVKGTVRVLSFIVDFSDAPATLPIDIYRASLDDENWSDANNVSSVKRYYLEVSRRTLTVEHTVFGIYRAPETFAVYDKMPYGAGAQEILKAALAEADAGGFDFSSLSTRDDPWTGRRYLTALNLIYTGEPATWAEGMWWHQGWWNGFSADGVTSDMYACGEANAPLDIGTTIHEDGHMICGWPDVYLYSGEVNPIQGFCIMGDGWVSPPPPNPLFRTVAGWSDVFDITSEDGTWTSIANDAKVYKYTDASNPSEYFLIEARKRDAYLNLSLPDEGLTIWRVDEDGGQQNWPETEISHLMVNLVHANDEPALMEGAAYHAGFVDAFNDESAPSAKWWSGAESGLDLHTISEVAEIMTFITGDGSANADTDIDTDTDVECMGEACLTPTDETSDTAVDSAVQNTADEGAAASSVHDSCGCSANGKTGADLSLYAFFALLFHG